MSSSYRYQKSGVWRLRVVYGAFRRNLCRSFAVFLLVSFLFFFLVIVHDYSKNERNGNDLDLNFGRLNFTQPRDVSHCRTWIHEDAALSADLVGCAVESAVIRSTRLPVCFIKLDEEDATATWLKRLKERYGDKILEFSPSLVDMASLTALEDAVATIPRQFQKEVLFWTLLYRFGGFVLHPRFVIVQNLETYDDFLWFDPTTSEVSTNFMQLRSVKHQLPATIIDFIAERLNEVDEDVDFLVTDTDWSRKVEEYCDTTISESTKHRMCRKVELISSKAVKAVSKGAAVPNNSLKGTPYLAFDILDEGGSTGWMREACPVTVNDNEDVAQKAVPRRKSSRRLR